MEESFSTNDSDTEFMNSIWNSPNRGSRPSVESASKEVVVVEEPKPVKRRGRPPKKQKQVVDVEPEKEVKVVGRTKSNMKVTSSEGKKSEDDEMIFVDSVEILVSYDIGDPYSPKK